MGSYVDYKAEAGRYSLLRVSGALRTILLTSWQCMLQCLSLCPLPVTVTSLGVGGGGG